MVVVGAGGALVEYDVLPGRSRAYDLLGLNGEAGVVPDVEPGPRVEGVLQSEYVDDDPAYWISYPPGVEPGDELPVVVALHGAGRTAETWCDAAQPRRLPRGVRAPDGAGRGGRRPHVVLARARGRPGSSADGA